MSVWEKLAEERIAQAQKQGAFDNLPGAGQPLNLEEDTHVPADLRLAYKVLKNAGYVSEEVGLINEINQVRDLLCAAPDEKARYQAISRLNYLQMKLDVIRPSSPRLQEARYASRLVEKFIKK